MATATSLSKLLQQSSLDDHEDVLKQANHALRTSKTDIQAQHARIVALLKLDRYDDALRALEDGGDNIKKQARLEYAYVLYKTGNLEAANRVVKSGIGSEDFIHVQAQTAYRSEDFSRALQLYEQLAGQKIGTASEDLEIKINRGATEAQHAFQNHHYRSRKVKSNREDMAHFETAFNVACAYLARSEWKQAQLLLARAIDLCNHSDELPEDDKKAELLPIQTQMLFVSCKLGKWEEAKKVCNDIAIADIPDPDTRHVAQTNVLAASRQSSNPFLSQRHFQSTSPKSNTLFTFQKQILERDALALSLQASKYGSVTRLGNAVKVGDLSSSAVWAGVFNAAARARNQTGKLAIKEMLPLLEKRPTDVGLLMTLVQLYVLTDNVPSATNLVESFLKRLEASTAPAEQDMRFAPGLVAVVVSLYCRQNRISLATIELANSAKHWRRKSKDASPDPVMLEFTGASLLSAPSDGHDDFASEIFSDLTGTNPRNETAVAGLIAASRNDADLPKGAAEFLPPIDQLIHGLSSAGLEEAGVAKPEQTTTVKSGMKRPAEVGSKPRKTKKVRTSRLPKDYDPNKKPDPERWLPLRDRSNWRPKGKKKNKGVAGGMATQGGVVSEDSRPSTPGQQQQRQQQQQNKGGLAKNKKKKGKGGR